jgi:hypothetical protein
MALAASPRSAVPKVDAMGSVVFWLLHPPPIASGPAEALVAIASVGRDLDRRVHRARLDAHHGVRADGRDELLAVRGLLGDPRRCSRTR